MRLPALTAAACLACLGLAGCGSWFTNGEPILGILSPYRLEVQQGNVVTKDQLDRLKPGMNRLQVRDVLGTPLLADAFHADRWDYIFIYSQRGRILQRREVVLLFDGDTLKSVEAGDLPTEREFIASIARSSYTFEASRLELTPEQIDKLPVPPKAPPAPVEAAASGAARSYPPLEPSS